MVLYIQNKRTTQNNNTKRKEIKTMFDTILESIRNSIIARGYNKTSENR